MSMNLKARVARVWASRVGKVAVVGGVVVAVVGGGAAYAVTNGITYPLVRNSVASGQVVDGSLIFNDLHQTVKDKIFGAEKTANEAKAAAAQAQADATKALEQGGKPGENGVGYGCDGKPVTDPANAPKCPGADGKDSMVPGPEGPKGEPGDPATDVKGSSTLKAVYKNVPVTKVGGSWLANKTDLGSFKLPAGTWVIHTSAKFTRLADDATPQYQTRPQLAVRAFATDSNQFGQDYGTVMNTIAPFKDADMFGSDAHRVVLTDETEFTVSAFGYQDDRGSDDSGKIQVTQAEIFVTQG